VNNHCLRDANVAGGKEVVIMNAHHIVSAFVTLALATGVSPVWARQDPAPVRDGPVSITALGGASLGSGQAGAAAGLTLSVDVNQRVSLEARSVYFYRGPGQSAMDLNVSVLVDLLTARRAVPYLSIGGGLYRAMFDAGNERSFGMMGGQVGSNDMGVTYGQMPMFYARRMGALNAPGDSFGHMPGFTDPAVSVGGGVRLDLTNHLYVRPDVRALTIFGGGDTYSIGSITFSVGYRF
jgi:hypothetical protein